jgi:hypothetical protein
MSLTPETRVLELLEGRPDLEASLIAFIPALGKLKNPVLRNTLAKVATLDHVSRVAGVPLPDLMAFLRSRLGEEAVPACTAAEKAPALQELPDWYDPAKVVLSIDVAAALASGEHPLNRVRKALAAAGPGGIVELRSAFEPAPLLDVMRGEGRPAVCVRKGEACHTVIRNP